MDPQPPAGEIFQRLDRTQPYPYTPAEYAHRLAWVLVGSPLFRLPLPGRVGSAWRRWLLARFGARLADVCAVARTCRITHPWLLHVGAWSNIGPNVTLYNLGIIEIGSHSVISQNAHLCAGTHDHRRCDLPLVRAPIRVGSGVWVCADAFVGPNVTIGDNAVVGARAVVVRDVPPNAVVAGNPARVVSSRVFQPPPH